MAFSRLAAVLIVSISVGGFPVSASAAPGDELWVERYNGPANDFDEANAVGVSPDGSSVFVTGYSIGSTSRHDFATFGYDASTGAELWAKYYNGRENKTDVASALAMNPDGSQVFVSGRSRRSTTGYDYLTVAYDASTGTRLWLKRYNGVANRFDIAFALGVSPDGSKVFVTGTSGRYNGLTNLNYATVAYSASTGAELWVKRYNGPASLYDGAYAVSVSPEGSAVFVTGSSDGATSDQDYATVAYDAATGAELWTKRYDGPGETHDQAFAVGVSPDGSRVFVTGYSNGSSSPVTRADYATLAYDASTGARLWLTRYNGPANESDYANDLQVGPDGSVVFVTGQSPGSSSGSDYATVAYDASTGVQLWLQRYNGTANSGDVAKAVGVSPDGSQVFVTGRSEGATTRTDYATVAYDASTGTEVWLQRYNGSANGHDYGNALAVSPDGSAVFATGFSFGSASGRDFATVAYDATPLG